MSDAYYESERVLSEYLLFHYGEPDTLFPWSFGPKDAVNFPFRVVDVFRDYFPRQSQPGEPTVALDIGCAVGRSTFELARYYDQVVGLDYSYGFIDAAKSMQQAGCLNYRYLIQGDQTSAAMARVDPDIDRERVSFLQGDAMDLSQFPSNSFDMILASNLICRLPDPGLFLQSLARLMRPSGILILSTPLTWLESFTPRTHWLGGTGDDDAVSAIRGKLKGAFDQQASRDLPMLIREHVRKFQWTVCLVSVWKKRSLLTYSS